MPIEDKNPIAVTIEVAADLDLNIPQIWNAYCMDGDGCVGSGQSVNDALFHARGHSAKTGHRTSILAGTKHCSPGDPISK
jgi:hypothetical protein